MKKLFLLLALLGVVATGCSTDEVDNSNDNKTEQPNENEGGSEDNIPENIFFGLDKESVTISPDGGSVDVIVYSNYKWEISGTSDWCTPSVTGGDANEDGQKVTFSADVADADREATFWFCCADKQIKFVVSQKLNNVIYYTSSNGEIVQPNDSSAFGATIISNTYKDGVGVIEFNAPITTIGEKAFYGCTNLTSITIPDSVTTIGNSAFWNCISLTSITIPDSVTTIGWEAFCNCSKLTSVTIPDGVTTIGVAAFYYCRSLTSITIPDSVTEIGGAVFGFCNSLTSITIPDSVTTIGEAVCEYCSSLQEFKGKFASEDGRCLIIDGVLNSFAPAGLTEYTIPDSVTSIGYSAFEGCDSLTSVTIPNSVTTIGERAFYDCRSLKSVTIPDSVTTIGEEVFCACISLKSVTIPDSVTMIGDAAFNSCLSLKSVTIPDSVTTIGERAFYDCDSLTSVTIGDSVTTIGYAVFYNCSSLTSITIPDSVTAIGWEAFCNCFSLTSLYCKATTPPVALLNSGYWFAFYDNASDLKIYVPMESVEAYKSARGWSEYANSIEGYNF